MNYYLRGWQLNTSMIKRIFDIILSILLFIMLIPILTLIYLLSFLLMGSPVIFQQNRHGLHANTFTFYKFRTMTNDKDKKGILLQDNNRLTKYGKFLRKTSLDELPSLWNVLQGDMSLVGPRPLLMEYLDRYSSDQAHRHDVKPGITGLAQIKGRNTLSWEEKFKYDIQYVNNHNIFLDLKILFLTVLFVLRFRGITPEKQEIMPEFWGSDLNESSDKTNEGKS